MEVAFILPEAYASYIRPVIKFIPVAAAGAPSDSGDRSSNDSELYTTFLPLPPTFNHHDIGCWEALAAEIQSWVLDVAVDVNSAEHNWGTDAFWMAYCAAYPTFPQGVWAGWNPQMPVAGTFGGRWLMGAEHRNEEHESVCEGDCKKYGPIVRAE
ncbi:hypothetical protein EW026_g4776 [Hermanssonia centrifuga]|uniref:Uncharacterized protein n=1 Tax=Hermanssonia centrifuga TaxID=98765 RepID=A0A4S4KG32_9APHY|nr:hypothetical protein EW026_g4776 [Hermanssonia centrifuga]